MRHEPIITDDGSSSIYLPEWNETYHSKHGAVREARHVYIDKGFSYYLNNYEKRPVDILEMGFGTGLNAFITFLDAEKLSVKVNYTGFEGFPVAPEEVEKLNYVSRLDANNSVSVFKAMHEVSWDEKYRLSANFQFKKEWKLFENLSEREKFDLVYFDAFGADVQPALWTEEIFSRVYTALRKDGILVTYAAKGSARRAMQSVGFVVERLPGPPGKRHMLRATKKVDDHVSSRDDY